MTAIADARKAYPWLGSRNGAPFSGVETADVDDDLGVAIAVAGLYVTPLMAAAT